MARVSILTLVLCAVACGGGDSEPARATSTSAGAVAPAARSVEPQRERPGPCRVTQTTHLMRVAERPRLVSNAMAGTGGLLLAIDRRGATMALPLDAAGAARGEARPITLPNAGGLLAFAAVAERFVAVTEGPCAESAHCLSGLSIDATGISQGAPASSPLAGAPLNLRRRVVGDELLVAVSVEHAPPRLVHFSLSGTGLTSTATELYRGPWPAETNATILSLFGDDHWGVLYRVGPTEAPTSHVLLASSDGPHEAPTLEHALAVDAATFDGDGVLALVSYEFFRPKLHRLHLDGSAHVEARELLPNATLPAPFRDRRRASLEHGEALALVLTSAAGDRLGGPLTLDDDGSAPADVARLGDGYLVALHRTGYLDTVHVSCKPGT